MIPQTPGTPPPATPQQKVRTPEELARLYAQATPVEAPAQVGTPPPGAAAGGYAARNERISAAVNTPEGAPASGRLLAGPRAGVPRVGMPPPQSLDMDRQPGSIPIPLPPQYTPEQVKKVTSFAGPTIGGVVGGARGGVQGAAVGSVAGDLGAMGIETLVGIPPTANEVVTRTSTAAAEGMIGEGVGRVLAKPLKGLSGKVTAAGREAVEYLRGKVTPAQVTDSRGMAIVENVLEGSLFGGGRYRKFLEEQDSLLRAKADQLLTQFGADRVTREEAGRVVQGAVEGQVGAQRGALAGQATAAERAASQAGSVASGTRGRLTNEYGDAAGLEASGKLWTSLQNEAHDTAKSAASKLYDDVDKLAGDLGGVQVSLSPLKEFIEQDAAKRGALGTALTGGKPAAMTKAVDRAATPPANELADQAISGISPGEPGHAALMEALTEAGISPESVESMSVSFRQAHEIRSALGKIMRTAKDSTDANARQTYGMASQLQKRIDAAMTEAAGGSDSPLRQAYDTATSAWKQMATTFEDGLLDQVARVGRKDPRLVVDTIIKRGRVEDITRAREALKDSPQAWRAVQAQHLDSLLKGPTGEWKEGDALLKEMKKLTPETIEAVYGKGGADSLGDLATALQLQGKFAGEAADLSKQAGKISDPLLAAKPFEVISRIIRPGSVEGIERAKQLLGPENWKKVQSAHAQDLLMRGNELVSGKELLNRLAKLKPETVAAAYPRGVDQGFWQLGRVMEQLQKKGPGTGGVWIQLTQAGAAASVIGMGGDPKAAGAILLGPALLSRIILSPVARRWLIQGMKDGGGTAATLRGGSRVAGNLLSWLVREGLVSAAQGGRGPSRAQGAAPQVLPDVPSGRGAGPGGRSGQVGAPPPGPPR